MRPPALAVESVLDLDPPSLRMVVPPSWADSNGHMNMRWYLALFDDAGDELHERVGLTPEFHARRNTGTVDLEHHTNFLNEVMPGDTVAVYSRLVARSAKRLHYLMFLVNESKGESPGRLAAIFECMNAFADLTVRRTAPFPDEIAEKIDRWLVRDTKLGWPPPVSGAMQV
ncbi:MAG TPA: thioesterase family protein [Bryobacteraceae bacterium]|jgi:acyl-CoA thioester hydrolase|nr:thioesterase family protein [Bryobacteraceae bacterium]